MEKERFSSRWQDHKKEDLEMGSGTVERQWRDDEIWSNRPRRLCTCYGTEAPPSLPSLVPG